MSVVYLVLALITITVYGHSIIYGFRSSPSRSPLQVVLLPAIFLTWAGAIYIGFSANWPSIGFRVLGGILCLLALCLFFYSHRQHRNIKPCKAFSIESPQVFVTSGPYRFVRHPIYSAYLLSTVAFGFYSGHLWFVFAFVILLIIYTLAASREERSFLESPFGDAYRIYLNRSGRFFPRLFRSNGG